uniref:Uncharacterized protein n=1 Tax=Arundo donax TaxID=35708 RepID=A0A0A9F4U3_ARUDO
MSHNCISFICIKLFQVLLSCTMVHEHFLAVALQIAHLAIIH